jgi:hypothetical protein
MKVFYHFFEQSSIPPAGIQKTEPLSALFSLAADIRGNTNKILGQTIFYISHQVSDYLH